MAAKLDVSQAANAASTLIVRLCASGIALVAIVWVSIALPQFWADSAAFQAAARIIAGDSYSREVLAALVTNVESTGGFSRRPAALAPLVVIQLLQTEEAITREEQSDATSRLAILDREIMQALTASPNAAYQWLALYWADSRLKGYNPRYLQYLRMSYEAAPLEGWVALRRNRIALSLYAVLDDGLKEAALTEFINIVRSQFFADAVEVFGNATPIVRRELIAKLSQLKETDRKAFARTLNEKGLSDVPVPGVNLVPSRPWR